MSGYILRRLAALVPVLVGLSIFSFALGQVAPGDTARSLLLLSGGAPPTEEQIREVREEYGLDDPAVVQYGRWARRAIAGDLGASFRTGQPVTQRLRHALPITLRLALLAFLIVVALGVPLGVIAALAHGRLLDHATRLFSLAGVSLPSFWLGYLLIGLFSVRFRLLPPSGVSQRWSYLLPAVALSLYATAVMARLTRASMLEVLDEDFIRGARARGLAPRQVVGRHALRVAVNPILTYGGLVLGGLLGGAVIIEKVFAVPGVGKLVIDAINDRDFPVVQGFVLVFGTVVLLVNLGVDLLYAAFDPRVRIADAPARAHAN